VAPPSTENVATRSEVQDIDKFGRVITAIYDNDRYRSDDDICVEAQYAEPVGQNEQMRFALSSQRIWDRNCNKSGISLPYAVEFWEYDNLPPGSVSEGRVTAHTVERRATDTGAPLGTPVREFEASYDVAGNPTTITRKREDGAVRKVAIDYEPFGLAAVRAKIDATGAPPMEVAVARDPISLDALTTKDANQTQRGREFDGFGRVARSTVTPPGGSPGVLSTMSYLGFSGSDPLGRRIVTKSFSDPVAPGNLGGAVGRTGTVHLDELGRQRRTEIALGEDYSNQILIVGARTYDELGRVAFKADPFLSTEDAATAYGTTYLFKSDGTPACFIRGRGPQLLTMVPDEPTERYPTCFSRSFDAHTETVTVRDAASLLANSGQTGVMKLATSTAIGRVISRSTTIANTRLEYATFAYDRLGQLTSMTRFQDAAGGTNPVQWSWHFDSLGHLLQIDEPEGAPRFTKYSDWGELLEVKWTDATSSPVVDHRIASTYDALGRMTHHEELRNEVADPDTVNDYLYDVGVSVAPQVTPTNVLGRLAQVKAPTGDVFLSYDAFGRTNARIFTGDEGGNLVEKTAHHADGTPSALEFFLPDTGYQQERVDYSYDSAARLRSMKFFQGSSSQEIFEASLIDPFGRVRNAKYGGKTDYTATYPDSGRRLMNELTVSSVLGARRIMYLDYDPLGRERMRREIKDAAATGPETNFIYDALGRLSAARRIGGATDVRTFGYDPLGNTVSLGDAVGADDATLSYRTIDRDRICRVGYGNGGLGGNTACNVVHDAVGNIVEQPTRTGSRKLSYFASGQVRTIEEQNAKAHFRYNAFGNLQELDIETVGLSDTRHDRHYGGLLERRDQVIGGSIKSFISRQIPGPGGIVASRRGTGSEWIFHFREGRGNRFFTDKDGVFLQDVDYQPYGEAKSSGTQPGSAEYTSSQWNGRDALAAFGLSRLGARIYDPVIGRFLSRDPLVVPRTAATTNPYAFALNDPVNLSDPSGLDCNGNFGQECQGPGGNGNGFPGGGPSEINPPGLYIPSGATPPGFKPLPAFLPPSTTALVLTEGEAKQLAAALPPNPRWLPPLPSCADRPGELCVIPEIDYSKYPSGGVPPGGVPPPLGWLGYLFEQDDPDQGYPPIRMGLQVLLTVLAPEFALAGTAVEGGGILTEQAGANLVGSKLVEGGVELGANVARGNGVLGGSFVSTYNAAGGEVFTSTGQIAQADFRGIVETGRYWGQEVKIISGVHGEPNGIIIQDIELLKNDVEKFRNIPGVTVFDYTTLESTGQLGSIINSEGRIIGGFCNSGVCLGNLIRR
jgi:RHS repeat-associated protein